MRTLQGAICFMYVSILLSLLYMLRVVKVIHQSGSTEASILAPFTAEIVHSFHIPFMQLSSKTTPYINNHSIILSKQGNWCLHNTVN